MKKILILLCFFIINYAQAQNVGIGTNSPNASAALVISSTNKGLLIPRLTTAQRNAIASPANGLMVFDTNTGSYWYRTGGLWKEMAGGNNNNPYNTDSTLTYGSQVSSIPSYNANSALSFFDSSLFLYDSGGPSGNYSNNENYTVYVADRNQVLFYKLTVIEMNLENLYDSLIIYVNKDSVKLTGNRTGVFFLDGPDLSVTFKSNNFNTAPGYKIRIDKIYSSSSQPSPETKSGWIFIPSKLAVRGGTSATAWSDTAVGLLSFDFGRGNKTTGIVAINMGENNTVTGLHSIGIGANINSKGIGSVALGENSTATGDFSVAASGGEASGSRSMAMQQSIARGYNSVAMGSGVALQNQSIVIGQGVSTAAGAVALGYRSYADSYECLALGISNDTLAGSNKTTWVSTDPLLYVGNGQFTRHNALVIYKNANTDISGYTRLGETIEGAPRIKMKKLTGISAATQGTWVNVPHGLNYVKIISVNILMAVPGFVNIPPSYTFNNGYEYQYQLAPNQIVVINTNGNSANILSKNFTIVITYEE